MTMLKQIVAMMCVAIFAGGCTSTTTAPSVDFASENGISLKYSAYDSVPTLTAKARDIAVKHCAQFGKHANYRGGNAVNLFTAEEVHQFACEQTKTNDAAIIAAQSDRPEYVPVTVIQPVYY